MRYVLPFLLMITLLGCGGPSPEPQGRPSGPPPPKTPAERMERTMQELTARLALSPEQASKVRAILQSGEAKKAKLEPEGGRYDSPDAMSRMLGEMRRVDRETQVELSKVLSKDQMDEYMDYLEDERERLSKGRRSSGKFNPPPPLSGIHKPGGRD